MELDRNAVRRLVDGAHDRAGELGIRVTVAVVDAGGWLLALDRDPDAPALSTQIAEAKAQGAAVWQREGSSIAAVQRDRPAFLDAVSELSRLPLIPGDGSLLIREDDRGPVRGAVGVSGGTPDEDRDCCEAALRALAAST